MTTLPTTKHALVIQGSEEEKQQACIEIRDWAVKNGIPIYEQDIAIKTPSWNGHRILFGSSNYSIDDLMGYGYTIHHTVDSFKKVFEVGESEVANLPIEFVEWYSGMTREKIMKAVERWKRESAIFIELTNPKN